MIKWTIHWVETYCFILHQLTCVNLTTTQHFSSPLIHDTHDTNFDERLLRPFSPLVRICLRLMSWLSFMSNEWTEIYLETFNQCILFNLFTCRWFSDDRTLTLSDFHAPYIYLIKQYDTDERTYTARKDTYLRTRFSGCTRLGTVARGNKMKRKRKETETHLKSEREIKTLGKELGKEKEMAQVKTNIN